MIKRVGVIGMGIMGAPMALSLLRGGFEVTVYNRSREKCGRAAEAGATLAATPRELAEQSDAVVLVLANDQAVTDVVLGEQGVLSGGRRGSIVVDSSTVHPRTSKATAEALAKKGIGHLDAPVTGSRPQAESGELQFLVGGQAEHVRACTPLFEALGKRHVHLGPTGSGACVKLANNAMVAIHMAAVAEAANIARRYGVAPEQFLDVILHSGARSAMAEFKGPKMLRGDFHADFALALMNKDVNLASDLAATVGQPAPMLTAARETYGQAVGPFGELDFCGIYRWFEGQGK